MKLRKGFTLVELLIVIVIIGVLAGAMLLASGAATASAEASNIVSNLRSLQSASLMLFADHMDVLQSSGITTLDIGGTAVDMTTAVNGNTGPLGALTVYTANPTAPVWASYSFVILGDAPTLAGRAWWVGTDVDRLDVGRRLQGRRENVGLFNAASAISSAAVIAPTANFTAGNPRVYMLIRSPVAGS